MTKSAFCARLKVNGDWQRFGVPFLEFRDYQGAHVFARQLQYVTCQVWHVCSLFGTRSRISRAFRLSSRFASVHRARLPALQRVQK